MRSRGGAVVAAACAVVVVVVAVVLAGDGSEDETGDAKTGDAPRWGAMIDDARSQLGAHAFTGTMVVLWRDDRGRHRAQIDVRHDGGVTVVETRDAALTSDATRVVHDGRTLATQAGPAFAASVPLAEAKYDVDERAGSTAGRATVVYEARRDGVPVGRVAVDRETGLVLERETLGPGGAVVRAVWFEELSEVSEVHTTSTLPQESAAPRAVADLEPPLHDPARAGDGFHLLGRWRHPGDVWHLYYSDGLFGVSVFEQRGTLDWDALPPGGATTSLGGVRVRHYRFPAADAWVFEHDGVVYTCVADAPAGEALAVAADVAAGREPGRGLLERVERLLLRRGA